MIKTLLNTQQGFNPGVKGQTQTLLPPRPQATIPTSADIKVEQAFIDLQDMKIRMVDTKPTETINFRQSAYTEMNTTTSELPLVRMHHTGSSFFTDKNKPLLDQTNKDLDSLTKDQLKERLLIAETIMKRQYARNKELEKQLDDKSNQEGS